MDVLLVEDEALVREIVAEGLYDDGLAVVEAASAEQALAMTETAGAPDVVVTDVNLGTGMSGLALAEEVHRRWPEAGVVIMTGNPAGVQAHTFGEQERFLTKPFGNARLVSAVRELMGRSPR
ncbi:response regulator [Belnapia sp. T6]|uniref:Response regulator n=1 Tax=Belnapia mucosa TaxID=2804532 RepID=A0ABS1V0E1_9PROT|nr:response regulator [Belnapia mucosa]MBL6454536.1 response regulator [Belnapia mucosa]